MLVLYFFCPTVRMVEQIPSISIPSPLAVLTVDNLVGCTSHFHLQASSLSMMVTSLPVSRSARTEYPSMRTSMCVHIS